MARRVVLDLDLISREVQCVLVRGKEGNEQKEGTSARQRDIKQLQDIP